MRLGIIPARGGSQRIPRKNIKEFCGKPIIAWSIEAALKSGAFDRVLISTDDSEIADIAKIFGAEVPFMRPSSLSNHLTPTIPVVEHAIKWANTHSLKPTEVCCIYATAPMIDIQDLQQGLQTLKDKDCDYVFSATSYAFPIQRAFQINKQDRVEMFYPEYFSLRSQDLPFAFHDAGQFYWGKPEAWLSQKPMFSSRAIAHLIPRHRVQDIDTSEDWLRAELMFEANRKFSKKNKA
jgi:N-acylneuraminate cytidylyltransferase